MVKERRAKEVHGEAEDAKPALVEAERNAAVERKQQTRPTLLQRMQLVKRKRKASVRAGKASREGDGALCQQS